MTRSNDGPGRGWHGEPGRHSLARRGIKTPKLSDKSRGREVTFSWYNMYRTHDNMEAWEGEIRASGQFVGELKIEGLQKVTLALGDRNSIQKGEGILIEEIYIDVPYRFHGFGAGAVNELKGQFDKIQASTKGTQGARGFWKKMGFKEIEKNYWEWKR